MVNVRNALEQGLEPLMPAQIVSPILKAMSLKKKNKEKFQKYLSKYPNRHEVRMQTNNAIDKGLIVRAKNCENCGGSENIEAHHDNYNYPLNIKWLCKNYHASWHCENTPIYQTH